MRFLYAVLNCLARLRPIRTNHAIDTQRDQSRIIAQTIVPEDVQAQATTDGAVRYLAPSGQNCLVVYHGGAYRVFINRCPHRRLPLDRGGRVLRTADQQWLICGNHGAKFDPLTGQCVAGPCTGKGLQLAADLGCNA